MGTDVHTHTQSYDTATVTALDIISYQLIVQLSIDIILDCSSSRLQWMKRAAAS